MGQSRQTAGTQNVTGAKIGGQYKHQEHDHDYSVELSAEDQAWEDSVEAAVRRVTELIGDEQWCSPEVARHHAAEWVDEATGYELTPEDAVDIYRFRRTLDRYDRDYFPSLETLGSHGYTSADVRTIYGAFPGQNPRTVSSLFEHGVTVDRLNRLEQLGVAPGMAEIADAFADFPDDEIPEWMDALRSNRQLNIAFGGWENLRRIGYRGQFGHRITPAEAAEYAAIGAKISYVIDVADSITPDSAKAFAEASGRDINDCFHYFEWNQKHPEQRVTAEQVKAYGPKLNAQEISELAAAGINPKAARSIKAADGRLSTPEITALTKAHITTGAEYKQWRDITSPIAGSRVGTGYASEANEFVREQADTLARIVEAKAAGVPADTAAHYVTRGVHRPTLWKRLADAGIEDLGPWIDQVNNSRRANILVDEAHRRDSVQSMTNWVADFNARGGTAERLGSLLRAGIPIDRAANYIDSTDPWGDAAIWREKTIAAEQAEYDAGMWRREPPKPWAHTADTYTQG